MSDPSRGFKWASSLWAIVLGIGIIALAGSIMLPSTKRARVDWDEVRRMQAEEEAAAAAAATTLPSTAPSTAPSDSAARSD